ncbi:MAG: glycosyltransferase [Albidovulum sp.]
MTEKMHVLVINVFFAPHTYGGATHVAEQVSRQLIARSGARVTAISVMARPEFGSYLVMKSEAAGIVNYLINLPTGRSYRQMYNNPEVINLITSIARELKPDVAHVHCVQDIGAGVLPAFKALGIPTILSVHDFWWLCERQFMIRPDGKYCGQNPIDVEQCVGCVTNHSAARDRHTYLIAQAATANLVTYPSTFARDLCERSGLAPGKGVVWENGTVPPSEGFAAAQAERRADDPRIVFGFVGGPSPIKGWPIVQDTFRTLGRTDLKGYLVDASLDGSWYAKGRHNELQGEWIVHPRYDSTTMDDFYVKIDVLLFLSQWKETFGLTIREALARGIHVIQTDGGGTVEHGGLDRVRLLKIGDGPAQLRPEIERILDNPECGRPLPMPVHTYADQADALFALVYAHCGL